MSQEQLKSFVKKVTSDTTLQEKIKAATSTQAAIEIAKEAGFSITAEDIQAMASSMVELSDEELEAAAGGGYDWEGLGNTMACGVKTNLSTGFVPQTM